MLVSLRSGTVPSRDPSPDPSRDDDVVSRLQSCHSRIRHFLDIAGRLRDADAPPDQVAEAAQQLARYFSVGFPLHAADEEESLLPRLQLCSPQIASAVERMADEHKEIDSLLSSLLPVWRGAAAWPTDRSQLCATEQTRRDFDEVLRGHLALEEAEIFPTVARLSAAHQADLLQEMRSRRR